SDVSSESRMKMLEMQVQRLTNALTLTLMNGSGNESTTSAILSAIVPTPPLTTNGRGRKNGFNGAARGQKRSATNKKSASKRKRHLSSDDDDSDLDPDSGSLSDPAEPFNPTAIEDLK